MKNLEFQRERTLYIKKKTKKQKLLCIYIYILITNQIK